MTKSFLDTTIVVDLSGPESPASKKTRTFVEENAPAEAPQYVLRELLSGHLQNLCDVHNRLKASRDIGEAVVGLAALNPVVGRKKQAKIDLFAAQLKAACAAGTGQSLDQVRNEMCQSLSLAVQRLWQRAVESRSWRNVQPLGCFGSGSFSLGANGQLVPPQNTFNCDPGARCSAAGYLYERIAEVEKICAALHPDALPEKLKGKREITQRRAALKELRNLGPKKFNKGRCRALGDAYFAIMCPATAWVVSTNELDFLPMCQALGKQVVNPNNS